MNFSNLRTHNSAPERAFEALCNQLFEQWLRREYPGKVTHFATVNGAGGDGGVEAYAFVKEGFIFGVQAKWFRNSLGASQINQLTGSVITAMSVRPQLTHYIICLPRDFQSDKIGRGGNPVANTEEGRLGDMLIELNKAFPQLSIELWNEHRILSELQQPGNEGIRKYWFDREIITIDYLQQRFALARAGWLRERYIPDLHAQGSIDLLINKVLYNSSYREATIDRLQTYCGEYNNALYKFAQLAGLLNGDHPLKAELLQAIEQMEVRRQTDEKDMQRLLHGEPMINRQWTPPGGLQELQEKINAVHLSNTLRNAVAVVKITLLLLKSAPRPTTYTSSFCSMITGGPATGKTHGVANAVAQRLQQSLPAVIIQARSATATSWASILQEALGGIQTWTDFEILSGLEALAHTCDIERARNTGATTISPEPTRVLICVDGIDEARDDANWQLRIRETQALHEQYPRIVFVFTMRYLPLQQTDFSQTKWHNAWMAHLPVNPDGDAKVAELAPRYLDHFKIRYEKSPWIGQAFRDALSLKLFCEAYAGQDIDTTDRAVTTSLTSLLNNKIQRLTEEFANSSQPAWSSADQFIRQWMLALPDVLERKPSIARTVLIDQLQAIAPMPPAAVARALDLFCLYGLLNQEQIPAEDGLSPVTTQYSITYQSYLDYFVAIKTVRAIISQQLHSLPDKFKYPHAENALVYTARILFEDHHLLLGENGFLTGELDAGHLLTIQLMVLQHSNAEKINAYLPQLKEQFLASSDARLDMLNYFIKPCLDTEHRNLAITFTIDLISDFPNAAAREQAWESPLMLLQRGDTLLNINDYLELELRIDDSGDGAPLLLAWSLVYPDQSYREGIRADLIAWAIDQPNELIRLLNHFFPGRDTQIQEDLLVVMASVALQTERGLAEMAAWIQEHLIEVGKTPFDNPVIRQCCWLVVEKAYQFGVCSYEVYAQWKNVAAGETGHLYLPPIRVASDGWVGGPLADCWYMPQDIVPPISFTSEQSAAWLVKEDLSAATPNFGKWLLPRDLSLITDPDSTQAWHTLYHDLQLNEPHRQATGSLQSITCVLPREQFASFVERLPQIDPLKAMSEQGFNQWLPKPAATRSAIPKEIAAQLTAVEEGAAWEITHDQFTFTLQSCIANTAADHWHGLNKTARIPARQVRDWLHIITLHDDILYNATGDIKALYDYHRDQSGEYQELVMADRNAFEQGAAATGLMPFWLVRQSNTLYREETGDYAKHGDYSRYWIVWQEAGELHHKLWWQQKTFAAVDQ